MAVAKIRGERKEKLQRGKVGINLLRRDEEGKERKEGGREGQVETKRGKGNGLHRHVRTLSHESNMTITIIEAMMRYASHGSSKEGARDGK